MVKFAFLKVLEWIHDEGEVYLSTRPNESSSNKIDKLLQENEIFVEKVKVSFVFRASLMEFLTLLRGFFKEQREKVRIFLELGDGMVNKDAQHIHSGDIRQWMTAVRQRYVDFSQRMDKYKAKLESRLGKPEVFFACF